MNTFDVNALVDDIAAAAFLKTSRQTLANWRSTKRHPLPYVKVGSLVRYRISDLAKFVEDNTIVGGAR